MHVVLNHRFCLFCLPMKAQRELGLPRVGDDRRNRACCSRADASRGQAEIRPIQNVEEFRTELQTDFLVQAEILVRAEIPCEKARSDQDVASGIAKRVLGRVDETGDIEPFVNALVSAGRLPSQTRLGRVNVPVLAVGFASDTEKGAPDCAVTMLVTCHPPRTTSARRFGIQKSAPMPERRLIDQAQGEPLPVIEVREAIVRPNIARVLNVDARFAGGELPPAPSSRLLLQVYAARNDRPALKRCSAENCNPS